jgi:hypothetical protein
VRSRKASLHARVNGNLSLRFTGKGLTSFSGLELFGRYLKRIQFAARLRDRLRTNDPAGDFSSASLVSLVIAMLVLGARRLRHVRYLIGDPIVLRFAGLSVLPSERTVARWLGRCTLSIRESLLRFMGELIVESVRPLRLRRITLDVDGTVCSTGMHVERAFRGYNPHRRKVPSYYPITAHLAQTGHILRVRNRSGNVHDGKASISFLRDLVAQARETMHPGILEFRLDGAFFRKEIVAYLERRAEYAIKVPFYRWVGLKDLIQRRRRWRHLRSGLHAFEAEVELPTWKKTLRVVIYRKKVYHKSPKNYQLDLFDPTDGHWEYSAITTNKTLKPKALWDFMAGRGMHEKILAEIKTGYAFATIPTLNYAANSTWQILSVFAHNLIISFQIACGAQQRPKTAKRSPLFRLKSILTLRYELFNRAGILQHPSGRATLTLSENLPTKTLFNRCVEKLAPAA